MTRYRDVRRPRDEADRRLIIQHAGGMLARAFEAPWRYKLPLLVGASAYARRANERCEP